jgi:5-methylcytosine-specific restriction endonuclease McrA
MTWYQRYLQSPHWKATREWALERASRLCQLCRSGDRVEVHHNTYERVGRELPGDLIVLCGECHGRHHVVEAPAADPRVVVSSVAKPGKWNVLRNSYRRPA